MEVFAYRDLVRGCIVFRIEVPEELLLDASMRTLASFDITDNALIHYIAKAIFESSKSL